MNSEQKDFITRMQTTGVTQAEAFRFYDSLEPVSAKFMLGVWKGGECRTGHIMDGMLTIAPWYGKAFISTEKVPPLVFEAVSGKQYCVNPQGGSRPEDGSDVSGVGDSFDDNDAPCIFDNLLHGR